MLSSEGGGTNDVEPEDLDTIIFLPDGSFLPRVELLALVRVSSAYGGE
jgi:hypothetical protein